jgi:hypothetical protein
MYRRTCYFSLMRRRRGERSLDLQHRHDSEVSETLDTPDTVKDISFTWCRDFDIDRRSSARVTYCLKITVIALDNTRVHYCTFIASMVEALITRGT